MKVIVVPILSDNYSYLLVDETTNKAAAIDCAEPNKVVEAAKQHNVEITSILSTHHHWDHAGGNKQMKELLNNHSLPVIGGDDRIESITQKVNNNETIKVGALNVKVFSSPAHTTGHVLYYVEDEKERNLFTGDTLFIGGCGRLFEGDPTQMYDALYRVIGQLPEDTKLWVGHEYTVNNLLFAKSLEPDNQDINQMLEWSKQQRTNNLPTIPSTIAKERTFNPFMRVHLNGIFNGIDYSSSSPQQILGQIRKLKDNFKI
ncbi:hydroxyacylglutathione hydrolase [Cavenderia fasciculata]|uniref:hydroxyacylglutathione hydrolase n=1 Tax=Cavenderia fasciculata TaxID=261658 RepID=F4Q6L5_CACFS|nr:hydroxyacylglutathione hydrolase [Cavenderia fasciculata]EGG16525.1 hydroxyacylglutathione hydrolase [Cavenderia fasciculata]|eukprot:XP_004354925.1 hydroxyacylglutathione hydrolase [Cavenderia fasciculata]